MLLHGDCLHELDKIEDKSINLIYMDPPFFTQKVHTLKSKNNDTYQFNDTWDDLNHYLQFMKMRIYKCKDKLSDNGSIFVHCDKSASHYLRVILDEVFGIENFQNEIIWSYKRWSNSRKGLLNSHQIIYFYSKTDKFKFNTLYTNYSKTTNLDQIFQKRARNENGKTGYKKDSSGNVELLESKKGVPLSDVWEIPYLNPKAKERVGYPTQKPLLLLERIIEISTDEEDLVLDPFCGSGTTLVAAKLLQREYIGIDSSIDAINLSQYRLDNPIKTNSQVVLKTENSYHNILNEIEAEIVERNSGIDGFLKINGDIKPVPIRVQRNNETINDTIRALLKAAQKNNFKFKVIIPNRLSDKENIYIQDDVLLVNNIQEFKKQKLILLV